LATKAKASASEPKAKARKLAINQLIITSAYEKTFSSGKTGFFGQGMDSQTGDKYQIIGAVKLTPKAS